jgi:hypothetical protein
MATNAPPPASGIRELDRLTATLSQKAALGDVPSEQARFLAAFWRIHLSTTDD